MKKVSLFVAVVFCMATGMAQAWVTRANTTAAALWGYSSGFSTNGSAEQFMLAGRLGKGAWGGCCGTFGDEGGVIGVIAEKIVEHGAYFCPYQIQCGNCRKCHQTWTKYFRPNGYSANKCVWLCEEGWSGTDCAVQTTRMTPLDSTATNTSGRFSGLRIKNSGGDAGQITGVVPELEYEEYNNGNRMVVLGVTRFLNHGVVAQPVYLQCSRYNWKSNDSSMTTIAAANGTTKILCASGYKPNATRTDCEEFEAGMGQLQTTTFCANFPLSGYDPNIHELVAEGGCTKYFCKESGKAFKEAGSTECTDCSTGVRGGASRINGLCIQCNSAEYFDTQTNSCKQASAYSKVELMFGRGQSQSSRTFDRQCWPLAQPADYKKCVETGGAETSAQSGTDTTSTGTARTAIRRY